MQGLKRSCIHKMKRKLSALLAAVLAAGLFVSAAYASSGYQSGDVPIGSSNEVLMVGTVVPSVMSVTMPTYVPFHVSRTIEGDNCDQQFQRPCELGRGIHFGGPEQAPGGGLGHRPQCGPQ
jgi:hypothetical protein